MNSDRVRRGLSALPRSVNCGRTSKGLLKRIKRAIEAFYGVQVDTVRTMIVRGKTKRFGRHFGKRKNWKKAYVTLAEGETINVFA